MLFGDFAGYGLELVAFCESQEIPEPRSQLSACRLTQYMRGSLFSFLQFAVRWIVMVGLPNRPQFNARIFEIGIRGLPAHQ